MEKRTDIKLTEHLRARFGLENFLPLQEEALERVLEQRDLLVLMPTGGGKSLLYQFVATLKDGLVLVISPLIALMDDQVLKAREKGIQARVLHSGLDRKHKDSCLAELRAGQIEMLFVTPERFRKPDFREAVMSHKIRLLAVDEAHCISQWGHDFRPDYSRLGEIRQFLGVPPTLALTATATPQVQKDILQSLGILDAEVMKAPMERSQLGLFVHDVYGWEEKIRSIVGLHFQAQGSVIVYASLIQSVYKIKRELERLGLAPMIYHGQMNARQRLRTLKDFLQAENALILATPAFGLGVDKPDLRAVIHAEIPGSIESYFQEVGRAGRDGLPATAHLLLDPDDISIQEEFIKWANPEESVIEHIYRLIEKRDPGLDQRGFDYLREQINYYNRRDYRAETAVALLERWGCLSGASDLRFPYVAQEEPDANDFKAMKTEVRKRVQTTKLLQLVQLVQETEGCRQKAVIEYFGEVPSFSGQPVCGVCDLCLRAGGSS